MFRLKETNLDGTIKLTQEFLANRIVEALKAEQFRPKTKKLQLREKI